MSKTQACAFCGEGFTAEEADDRHVTYREVTSWVHGPKLQGPVLREQTGRIAHNRCIKKLLDGQSVDQQPLPGLDDLRDQQLDSLPLDERIRNGL